jgi:membrane-associated phospholipid phosphatase
MLEEEANLRQNQLPQQRIEQLSLPERVDVEIIEKMRPLLQKPTVQKVGMLGNLGDEPPLLAISAALLIGGTITRKPALQRAAIRMALAHLIAIGFKEVGKNNVDRTRPDEQLKTGTYHMSAGHSHDADLRSFPSGHTAGALAVARAFSRDYPRYTKPVLAAAAVVGALQVPRRAHYPGDVLAGAVAGAVAEKIATFVIDRLGRTNRRLAVLSRPVKV